MYISICTRPDISNTVMQLSRYMSSADKSHLEAAKRVVRYLKGHKRGLVYRASSAAEYKLTGWADADFAGDLATRRSTSGYVFKMGDCTVDWRSKLQTTVAMSTTEAEYVALNHAARQAVVLRTLLTSLQQKQETATIIYEDNQGAVHIAGNNRQHQRTKHMDIKYMFVRERVEALEIDVVSIDTHHQLADILTKSLPTPKHAAFTELVLGHRK